MVKEINEMHYGQIEMNKVNCGLKEMRWNKYSKIDNVPKVKQWNNVTI